jgi:hypothetical protein
MTGLRQKPTETVDLHMMVASVPAGYKGLAPDHAALSAAPATVGLAKHSWQGKQMECF